MKPITITLQPPVTEYCTKCDYEASKSFASRPSVCPKCGEKYAISKGPKYPEEGLIYVYKDKGKFDLLSPNDELYNYVFLHVPGGKREYSFIVHFDIEIDDPYNPLEVAHTLRNMVNREYLFYSRKRELDELITILECEEVMEKQKELVIKRRFLNLLYHLYEMLHYHPGLKDEVNAITVEQV